MRNFKLKHYKVKFLQKKTLSFCLVNIFYYIIF